jgi:hypothetical protein
VEETSIGNASVSKGGTEGIGERVDIEDGKDRAMIGGNREPSTEIQVEAESDCCDQGVTAKEGGRVQREKRESEGSRGMLTDKKSKSEGDPESGREKRGRKKGRSQISRGTIGTA